MTPPRRFIGEPDRFSIDEALAPKQMPYWDATWDLRLSRPADSVMFSDSFFPSTRRRRTKKRRNRERSVFPCPFERTPRSQLFQLASWSFGPLPPYAHRRITDAGDPCQPCRPASRHTVSIRTMERRRRWVNVPTSIREAGTIVAGTG